MSNDSRKIAIAIYLVSLVEIMLFNLSKIGVIHESIATYIYVLADTLYLLSKELYNVTMLIIILIVLSLIIMVVIVLLKAIAHDYYSNLTKPITKLWRKNITYKEESSLNYMNESNRGGFLGDINYFALILLAVNVIAIRFTYFNEPQGYDTLSYIYYAERLLENPAKNFLASLYPIPTIIAALVLLGTSDISLAGILLPYIFGTISIILIYSAYKLIFSKETAFIATTLYVTSYTFIRLTYDLYGQLMAIGILSIILIPVSRKVINMLNGNNHGSSKDSLEIFLLLAILFLTHAPTFIIFISFLALTFIAALIASKTRVNEVNWRIKPKTILLISLLTLALIIAGAIYLSYRIQSYINLINNMLKEFSLLQFEISPKYFWPLLKESTLYLALTLIGCIVLLIAMRKKKEEAYMIISVSWFTYLVFIFILILGYQQGYRVVLYNNLSLILSYGIKHKNILKQYAPTIRMRHASKIKKKWIIIILVFFVLFGLINSSRTIINGYIKEYRYFSNKYYEKLLVVREIFGFNNKTIELIIHREKFWNTSRYLAYAVIGENVYFGTIKEFINQYKQSQTRYKNLEYIVLIRELIDPEIEATYLKNSKEIREGIYLISLKDILSVNTQELNQHPEAKLCTSR